MVFLSEPFLPADSSYRQSSKKALRSFLKSSFFVKNEKQSLETTKQIADNIVNNNESLFVCAFGGAGIGLDILQKSQNLKNKNITLLNHFDQKMLSQISALSKEQLEKSHWAFISKSGSTFELLFYARWLEDLYQKKALSLDTRLSFFTFEQKSPLLDWFQKHKAKVYFLDWPLSGRFSFFTENGKLQLFLAGLNPSSLEEVQKRCEGFIPQIETLLEILFYQFDKCQNQGEIYLLGSGVLGETLSSWFEKLWMESFFQNTKHSKVMSLRFCSFLDFTHFYLQDLVVNKHRKCVWGLEVDAPNFLYKEKDILRAFLKEQGVSNFFISFQKNNLETLENSFFIFYSLLYGLSHWLELDIFKQKYIDKYKKQARLL